MVQPYNYTLGDAQDPTQSFTEGLKIADFLRQRQLQQQQMEREQQRLQDFKKAETEFFGVQGIPTMAQTLRYASYLPKDQAELIMKGRDTQSADVTKSNLSLAGQVLSSLLSDNKTQAIDLVRQRVVAAKNSGDEPTSQQFDMIAKSLEAAPSSEVAFKNYAPYVSLLGEEGRKMLESVYKAQEQPFAQREVVAKASKAEADAIIAEAQAKFAPDKFGEELNLTKEQIAAAKAARRASEAAASASGAAAKRANAEAEQISAGIIPAEKRQEAETKFRKEYSDQTKGYQEVKSAYGRVLASEDNAVGDLSLIFGYMKMLDPGSVVREGEFATAQNAAGVPERIKNVYNQVISGERLSESQRSAFKGQAKKLYGTSQQQEAQVRQGISRIAKGYGLNTENIFYTATEVEPTAPKEPRLSTTPAQPSNYKNMSDTELMKLLGR